MERAYSHVFTPDFTQDCVCLNAVMTDEVQLALQQLANIPPASAEPAAAYHVFSIRPRENGTGAALNVSDQYTKQYITRKSHKKSRLGCLPCKTKRVKVQ